MLDQDINFEQISLIIAITCLSDPGYYGEKFNVNHFWRLKG